MSQSLPTHGFRWVKDIENSNLALKSDASTSTVQEKMMEWTDKIQALKDEQETGYFFEVDLEYPQHLHEKHDNFPLAPEHLNIQGDMLSPYQKDLAKDLGVKVGGEKLCLTLNDKIKYICHYRNLKMYLKMGLKLKKVHRVLEFKQSQWLKTYIVKNTELRQSSDNKFEENFFKLMNNSFFGKTCEDVRKYKDVRIGMTSKRVKKLIARPTMKQWTLYEENLCAIQLKKPVVELNKPRYIGMCILDLSKIVMYDFHYNFIMPNYPDTKLLFTDTDSFCYWIPTEKDLYKDLKGNEWIDHSNYAKDHPNFNEKFKLIPGKFKDEMGGKYILEFVGLRAKMYSILNLDGEHKATAKGVIRVVKEKLITHENYRQTLFHKKNMSHTGTKIIQDKHHLYKAEVKKTSLSPFNDKKYIIREGSNFKSYSFGHYMLSN